MKLDVDLVRDLLLKVEENPEMDGTREFIYETAEDLELPGHSFEELAYHIRILIEDGYLKGNPALPSVSRLTGAGHEFLGNIRHPGPWGEIKKRIGDLPDIGLKMVFAIGEAVIKKQLGV